MRDLGDATFVDYSEYEFYRDLLNKRRIEVLSDQNETCERNKIPYFFYLFSTYTYRTSKLSARFKELKNKKEKYNPIGEFMGQKQLLHLLHLKI